MVRDFKEGGSDKKKLCKFNGCKGKLGIKRRISKYPKFLALHHSRLFRVATKEKTSSEVILKEKIHVDNVEYTLFGLIEHEGKELLTGKFMSYTRQGDK